MTKICVVDNSPIFSIGLRLLLSAHGFEVVDDCGPRRPEPMIGAGVLIVAPSALADGEWSSMAVAVPASVPMLLLGAPTDAAAAACWRPARVVGNVGRCSSAETLLAAVRSAATGGARGGPVPVDGGAPPGAVESGVDTLSPRERQVLDQIADGLTHHQVARRLGISRHTVETYVKRVRSKLALGNKAELARAAVLVRIGRRPDGPPGVS